MSTDTTILVTGAAGFIGRNIVEALGQTFTPLTPTHNELDLLSRPAVNRFFSENDIDTVVHCAVFGGTRKTPATQETIDKNTRMFFNLAENRDYYTKLINLGSGAEYNKQRDLCNVSEAEFGEDIPSDEYGLSKYIISSYIERNENMYSLRLFGVFGKYEDYEFKFISNAIIKNLLHLPITIRQNVKFSWLCVDDFPHILKYFLTRHPEFSTYNITPSVPTDLVSIARTINSLSDYTSEIRVENGGMNFEYTGDNTRLIREIGDYPFTPVESGIKDLIRYYSSILPDIDHEVIRNDPFAKNCKVNLNASPAAGRKAAVKLNSTCFN